jgi:uncharacterized coiled-coil DUF342 family protein
LKEEQVTSEIEEIDQKLVVLREQIDRVNAGARICIEKRDELNGKFKKYRSHVQELEDERNGLNEKVRMLKLQRDATRAKTGSIVEEINVRRRKIEELKKKKPRRSRQQLEKELQKIEWTIQTTSLDQEEEKRLVEEVKKLEPQLQVYRKIEQHTKNIADLRRELKTIGTNANACHEELMATAQKSQNLHLNLVAKIDESKRVKAEADTLHTTYLQTRREAQHLYQEMKYLVERKKTLEDTKQEEDQNRRKIAEKNLKEKLESQARQRLQQGEKISWQEFQLLEEDGAQDSDTQN